MFFFDNIPNELKGLEHFPEDLSILIGENGSGKSTLLNGLSKFYLSKGKTVVAIANSIHDKFESGHRNFRALRGRSGRRQTRGILKHALENVANSDIQRLKSASRALEYIGFNSVIGFRIDNLNPNYEGLIQSSTLTQREQEQISFLLQTAVRQTPSDSNRIVWLQVENFSVSELDKSSLTGLFEWESTLKKLDVIERIEVFLKKNDIAISMLDASSGELALITSIVYLSTVINENTVILIDEPENSLHPKWQQQYSKILLDVFYFMQPKIIIATHSPLVVSGAELFTKEPKILKSDNFTFKVQKKEPLNVEEILYRFFDVSTPQNRFLSDLVVRFLNLLVNEKISLDSFRNEMVRLENKAYDPKQIEVLKAISNIAPEIISKKQ